MGKAIALNKKVSAVGFKGGMKSSCYACQCPTPKCWVCWDCNEQNTNIGVSLIGDHIRIKEQDGQYDTEDILGAG